MAKTLTVVDHPLVRHKLTILRDRTTPPPLFRQVMREIAPLLLYEATRDLELGETDIETPLESGRFPTLDSGSVALISILRAGNGLVDGMLDLMPSAPVGHVGAYRDHQTLEAVRYYFRVPDRLGERLVVVADPMLATGNTASMALSLLKRAGAKRLKFVALVAAPEGVAALAKAHPDVPIFAGALDRGLDEKGYILPGLGDAGDRLYGTL
ncbi:MAG: uracil phosphoribosyltransferase [Alphaproteobacteria bacterium]|nr:uracil phosphoribosyltransferase [Alphaproteobacteria bacterium]